MELINKISVLVRARPLASPDQKSAWTVFNNTVVPAENLRQPISTTQKFSFDAVYDPRITTFELYAQTMKNFSTHVIDGFNCTCFAYGQSCSGKTYTIFGDCLEANVVSSAEGSNPGVLPLCIGDLFAKLKSTTDRSFLVYFTYWELYNEDLKDLLAEDKRKLELRYTGNFMHIPCVEKRVHSLEDVLVHIRAGNRLREVAATDLNSVSSRSHAIARLTVESIDTILLEELIKANKLPPLEHLEKLSNHDVSYRTATLTIVDLAGSERQVKTNAVGGRFKEATNINKSLLTLGRVFTAITSNAAHVPYRDSNLTKILQTSLQGSCYTTMIACISLAQEHADETLNTLRYASNASSIETRLHVNEVITEEDAVIRLETERRQLLNRIKELEQRCKTLEEANTFDYLKVTSGATQLSVSGSLEPALKRLGASTADDLCLQSVALSPLSFTTISESLQCNIMPEANLMSTGHSTPIIFKNPLPGVGIDPASSFIDTSPLDVEKYCEEIIVVFNETMELTCETMNDLDSASLDQDLEGILACFLPEKACYVQTDGSKLYRPINTLEILSLVSVDDVLLKMNTELQDMYHPIIFLESNMKSIEDALEGNTISCLYGMLHEIKKEMEGFRLKAAKPIAEKIPQLLNDLDQAYKHSYEESLSVTANRFLLLNEELAEARSQALRYRTDFDEFKKILKEDYVPREDYNLLLKRIDDLTRQLSLETARVENTNTLLKQAQATSENMVTRLEDLTNELAKVRKDKDELSLRVMKFKAMLHQAKEGISALKDAYISQKETVATFKREKAEMLSNIHKLQKYKNMVVQYHQMMETFKANPTQASVPISAGKAGVKVHKPAVEALDKPVIQEDIDSLVNGIIQHGDSGVEGQVDSREGKELLDDILNEFG